MTTEATPIMTIHEAFIADLPDLHLLAL
jgi:hypothetical protein